MKVDTKTVMITVTESCNLSCTYCYENHKSQNIMTLETAKKIIDNELNHCEYDNLEIDLFGGEPFLNFELIQQIDDYIKESAFKCGANIIIFASTNGTLVHDKIKKWLEERKDYFICGLSFDGTNIMQNINRSNSADLIDLDFFKVTYPNQSVKMTVSVETLKDLSQGVIFLHEKGFSVLCNLAYNINWSDTKNRLILESELQKLIKYYLENHNIQPCSMLNTPISKLASEYNSKRYTSYCGAGVSMVSYDVYGTSYPCQFFMPLSVGKRNISKLKFYSENIPEDLIEEKCRKCSIQPLCPTCYGANFVATGNMYKHDDNYCELTKIIIKARSFFRAKQWELGQLNLSEDEETLLLKSIEIIQENL